MGVSKVGALTYCESQPTRPHKVLQLDGSLWKYPYYDDLAKAEQQVVFLAWVLK